MTTTDETDDSRFRLLAPTSHRFVGWRLDSAPFSPQNLGPVPSFTKEQTEQCKSGRTSVQPDAGRSLGKLLTQIYFRQHAQFKLCLIRWKDERPHRRKNNVRRGFQEGVNQITRRPLIIVNGHDIFSRRDVRDFEL